MNREETSGALIAKLNIDQEVHLMANSISKTEQQRKYSKEHDRLANLFTTDRFAFEMERKRLIDETIDDMCCSEEFKEKMRAEQKGLDRILQGSGSAENRFAMIQSFFWHHLVNNWQPALQEYQATLNSFQKSRRDAPALSLVKKTAVHH